MITTNKYMNEGLEEQKRKYFYKGRRNSSNDKHSEFLCL